MMSAFCIILIIIF